MEVRCNATTRRLRGEVDYDEFPEGTQIRVTFDDCCAGGSILGTLHDVKEYGELIIRDASVSIVGHGLTVEKVESL